MSPPALMDKLVEEVLLRLPPTDPASLVRAALACKSWSHLVSDPGFHRRFCEFHRTPPMIGFVSRREKVNCFTPTSSFLPPCAERIGPWNWYPIDARHGLFLFFDVVSLGPGGMAFVVSNPIPGEVRKLPMPRFKLHSFSAALLCGTAGCNHLDRPCGSFLVVFVGTKSSEELTSACFYSSESDTWSKTTSVRHPKDCVMKGRCSALVGNALYFICELSNRILEYDFGKQELAVISLPSTCKTWAVSVMTAEDGGLGFAIVQKSKLSIWSKEEAGPKGWEQRRVIQLESLLPVSYLSALPSVVAFADGARVIFTYAPYKRAFAIDLKSGLVRDIGEIAGYHGVFPYMSFYTPGTNLMPSLRLA